MKTDFDVIVIGMGPGGESVAGQLAEAGLSVLGIEKELVGGECPYWGCVPSKMMIRAADLLAEARRILGTAGSVKVAPDWAPVARRIREQATDNWDDRVAVDRFESKGGHFVRGAGQIEAPGRVAVGGTSYSASRGIVIATGSVPAIPPIKGLADAPYWTNRQAIEVENPPRSIIVLGGGAVGLELAQVFSRFGVGVTVVEALSHLLPMEEPEAGKILAKVLRAEGVEVHLGVKAESVRTDGDSFILSLESGANLSAERLLVATGRRANIDNLSLNAVGIDESQRWIHVDAHLRATAGVWAVGDLTGHGAFTHVADYQANIAARDILGKEGPGAEYYAVPRVTFTDPEVGSVGMTESQARENGIRIRIGLAEVPSTARGWIHGPGNEGFIKLVEDADRGVLVGGTSVGPRGGEVLSMLSLAVHAQIPTERLRQMIFAYPTFYRGIEDALRVLATAPMQSPIAAS